MPAPPAHRESLATPATAHARGLVQRHLRAVRRHASTGDPYARYLLGVAFLEGLGTEPDRMRGHELIEHAARAGLASAQLLLARLHHTAAIANHSREQAVTWYRAAARQGNPEAAAALGLVLLAGDGAPRDRHEACHWLIEALKGGQRLAAIGLMILCAADPGPMLAADAAAIARPLRNAPSEGALSASDEFTLGLVYEYGLVLPCDEEKAKNWYTLAARHGSAHAKQHLATYHRVS